MDVDQNKIGVPAKPVSDQRPIEARQKQGHLEP